MCRQTQEQRCTLMEAKEAEPVGLAEGLAALEEGAERGPAEREPRVEMGRKVSIRHWQLPAGNS